MKLLNIPLIFYINDVNWLMTFFECQEGKSEIDSNSNHRSK